MDFLTGKKRCVCLTKNRVKCNNIISTKSKRVRCHLHARVCRRKPAALF